MNQTAHTTFAIIAATLVAACSSNANSSAIDGGSATDASKSCAQRSGVYRFESQQASGNCGAGLAETNFSVSDGSQTFAIPYVIAEKTSVGKSTQVAGYFPECSGSVSVSADNCRIEYDVTCPISTQPGTLKKAGSLTWSNDAKLGNGEESLTGFDQNGGVLCSGNYNIEIAK